MVFTLFSNGTADPNQSIKQPKASLQPLKWANWQRVRSFTFVLFCQPFKNINSEPENKKPKNKEPRNQQKSKSKKPKHPKTKRTYCTPQGGRSGRELGLVILCFFLFCLAIAEMPSSNCQWLHSSDKAIVDVRSRNCHCMCKRTVKKPHSEGLPFFFLPDVCIYCYIATVAGAGFGDVLAMGCHFPWRERCFPSCPRVMSRPLFQSCATVLQECFPRARVSHKSVPPKCPTKVFVAQTCFTRPLHRTVRYLATVSYKGPSQECLGMCNAS